MKDFWFVLISALILVYMSHRSAYARPGRDQRGWVWAGIAWGVIFFEHLSKLH